MNVEILPSADGARHQFLSSYLVDEAIAVDAGCLGLLPCLSKQGRVEHVFLSHSHIDHVASLPLFLDNVFTPGPRCPKVYGSAATLAALREDVLNDRTWPDFERLSTPENRFVELIEIGPGDCLDLGDYQVSTLALEHVVPTLGFVVSHRDVTVAMISDTIDCPGLRKVLSHSDSLDGLFLECSFPSEMQELANVSKHLTPEGFGKLMGLVANGVPVIATHIKPSHFQQTVDELTRLNRSQIQVGHPGQVYSF